MGNMAKIVIGLVMVAVGLIVFPIVLAGAQTILTDAHIADYTGLETLVKIGPTLIFISFLFGGGLLTFQGIKERRAGGGGSRKRSLR